MSKINYLIGDATRPQGEGEKILVHICNNEGKWGKGFVLSLSRRWKEPEKVYREQTSLTLGKIQMIKVEEDTWVVNMIAQRGIKSRIDPVTKAVIPPVCYGAVRACLATVNDIAFRTKSTIHMPKIGAGLGGGNWDIIERIIKDVASVEVYVYELK